MDPQGEQQPREQHEPQARGLWRRIAGDGTHIGFWTLPVFIATALAGAVIAGAIANVYYGQQVAALEEETRAARTAAEVAAEDIAAARQEALDAIDEQLDGVRDALEVARPLEDPAAAGVVSLEVELTPPAPEPSPGPSPEGQQNQQQNQQGQGQGSGQADGAPTTDAEQPSDSESSPADGATAPETAGPAGPPPPVAGAPTRRATGFVVAVDGGTVFVATTFGAVADEEAVDGVAPAVTVRSVAGSNRGVVHAWDDARDVAIVRVELAGVQPLRWRPADVPLATGDVVVLAAVTPDLVGVQLPGRVGGVAADAIITDLPADPVFDGAPVVDALGRVVGLQSSTAAPFGDGSQGVVPARQLCVGLIQGCELLEEPDESDADAAETADGAETGDG